MLTLQTFIHLSAWNNRNRNAPIITGLKNSPQIFRGLRLSLLVIYFPTCGKIQITPGWLWLTFSQCKLDHLQMWWDRTSHVALCAFRPCSFKAKSKSCARIDSHWQCHRWYTIVVLFVFLTHAHLEFYIWRNKAKCCHTTDHWFERMCTVL